MACTQHYCVRMHHNFLDNAVSYPDLRSLLHSYVRFTLALQMFFNMHVYTCAVLDLDDSYMRASYRPYWTSLTGYGDNLRAHFVHTISLSSKLGQLP